MNVSARFVAVLAAAFLCATQTYAQRRVVLVAAANSPIESISVFEVRKVFLGISVQREGRFVRPLRNASSPEVEQIFLQSVIGQTKAHYERRLLNNLLRLGTVRPQEIDDWNELAAEITNDRFAVTYAFDNGQLQGMKVVRILWQE